MSPAQDPDSSSNQDDLPADVSRSDEHAEQWDALAKILGTSDPQEIVSRARALQQSVTALDDRLEDSSSAEMEAAIQDMREQLEHLRKQDADRSDRSDLAGLDAQAELHPKTEVLLDQLEASSLSEAQERIRSLTEQVDHLYSEKEALAEAGLMSSQEALDEITRLQRERDRLRAQQREGEETSPPALSSSQREEIAEVLGIDSVEEARELDDTVRRLSNQLDTLLEEKEALDDTLGVATADDILDLVQSLEGQLSTFYDEQSRARSSDTPVSPKIEEILGISSLEEAEELVSYVHEMNDRLEQLAGEHQTLVANGLDAETAVALIDSMEDQLVDLYEMVDVSGEGIQEETRLSSISPLSSPSETHEESAGDILGISTPSEARELDQMVRQMGVELDRLRSETRSLSEAGLTAEDALQMIDNMEDQLSALYDARDERAEINEALDALEAVLGVERPADAAPPEAISGLCQQVQDLLRDSFEDDRTSLWDTDDLKTTVRARVRELRDERDAYADRSDRLSTLEDILGVSTPEEARDLASLVENIDAQLQALYAEREKLRELGLASVEDAIDMIRSMEHQLQELG